MSLGAGPTIGTTIYSAGEIAAAVERLAVRIAQAYRRQPLLLLGVLKGALCLTTDLARSLARKADGPSEIVVEYMCVASYGESTRTSGTVRLVMDAAVPLAGRNVLLVDDVVDTGRTIASLAGFLEERRPASLQTCVLFDKPARREVDVPLDYTGLSVPDRFVIGYGLDYQELYRNLPYLAELRES